MGEQERSLEYTGTQNNRNVKGETNQPEGGKQTGTKHNYTRA